jgi:hypothetical protein
MDDFTPYGFLDVEYFFVPPGTFEPHEPTEDNQLAGPALPSHEELTPEVQFPFLHDPHPVYTGSAVSTGPLNTAPCFLNDDLPLCEQRASLQKREFLLFFILT